MTDTSIAARPTHTRHIVLALIVGAYMITYMDRVNIASAVPVIQKDLGFSMVTIGWIFASFRWGYAFFQIPGGWLGDRIGDVIQEIDHKPVRNAKDAVTLSSSTRSSVLLRIWSEGSSRFLILNGITRQNP